MSMPQINKNPQGMTPMGLTPDGFGIIEVKESQEMETPMNDSKIS